MTDDWGADTIRTFYDERLAENQQRSDERYQQLIESMRIEREAIDKRFDAANRFKETYTETLTRIENSSLKRVEFDSRMGSVQEKIETLSRTNWPLYSSFGGIIISMIVGLWVIVGLKIDATNQPVVVSLEQAKISNDSRDRTILDIKSQFNERLRLAEAAVSTSQQADVQSRTDRSQLNDRVTKIEDNVSNGNADRRSSEASLRAALTELESQICATDEIRNLTHANDLRVMSVLWKRLEIGDYPITNAYYPQVCNKGLYPVK